MSSSIPELTHIAPDVFLTIVPEANPHSAAVLDLIRRRLEEIEIVGVRCISAPSLESVADSLGPGFAERCVAVFDGPVRGEFSFRRAALLRDHQAPPWVRAFPWVVVVGRDARLSLHTYRRCANNAVGVYVRRFDEAIQKEEFPFGPARRRSGRRRGRAHRDLSSIYQDI